MNEPTDNGEIEKDLMLFLTEKNSYFINDETEESYYLKPDGSGYLINDNNSEIKFSWKNMEDDKIKIVLPSKVIIFANIQIIDNDTIKLIYKEKDQEPKNVYFKKHFKDMSVKLIKAIELTGFEVSYLWSDSITQNIYQFLEDGDGIIIPPVTEDGEEQENIDFKWYIDNGNNIKIGFDGKLIDIFLEEKSDENTYAIKLKYNGKSYDNVKFSKIVLNEDIPLIDEDIPERPEKIFISLIGVGIFLVFLIVMNIVFLTKGMSFFIQLMVSVCVALFFVLKFKKFFTIICKRDRLEKKGKKFGKIISIIDNKIVKQVEKVIYK